MSEHIYRSCQEPIRKEPSWDERWGGPDKGLIICWEVGRDKRNKNPELAERAENGELPILGWKGGIAKKINIKEKYGTLYYLAQWQGIRGEDLDVNLSEEREIICSATKIKVIFTTDSSKISEP